MKIPRLIPKKTPKGWQLNIPAHLSAGGKRQRRFFASADAATKEALKLRARIRKGEAAGTVLPVADSIPAKKALRELTKAGFSAHDLVEAARRLVAERDRAGRSITLRAGCREYVAAKGHRTARHLSDYERLPGRLPTAADKLLCEITPANIETDLAGLPGPARNLLLRLTRALFSFAIRRDWCRENPAGRVDFAHVAAPDVQVLTSKEIADLFSAAVGTDAALVPMLAIETFAGIRPAEAEKITWADYDHADHVLTVRAAVSKTRKARHIVLHEAARAWLAWHDGPRQGLIAPATGTPLRKRLRALRAEAKLTPWKQDCLRHSYASAALASGWRDISGLTLDMGHTSPAMLFKHYHRAVRGAEAAAVFAVLPPARKGSRKIVRFNAA
jgi:integrase